MLNRSDSISHSAIDCYIWEMREYLMKKYGYEEAARDCAPLVWYINTGRASMDFLHKMVRAKPFVIARRLHEGGTYEDVIKRVKYLLNKGDEEE